MTKCALTNITQSGKSQNLIETSEDEKKIIANCLIIIDLKLKFKIFKFPLKKNCVILFCKSQICF